MAAPVFGSHKRTVRSQLPDAIRPPFGLHMTKETIPVCPPNICKQTLACASQTRTVWSQLPRHTLRPVGAKRDGQDADGVPLERAQARARFCFHTRAVVSSLPLATRARSTLTATARTQYVCPSSTRRLAPVAASHMRTVLSDPPEQCASRRGCMRQN